MDSLGGTLPQAAVSCLCTCYHRCGPHSGPTSPPNLGGLVLPPVEQNVIQPPKVSDPKPSRTGHFKTYGRPTGWLIGFGLTAGGAPKLCGLNADDQRQLGRSAASHASRNLARTKPHPPSPFASTCTGYGTVRRKHRRRISGWVAPSF